MSLHLKTIHHNQSNDWFEPMPPPEGDVQEITDAVLVANLQEIEMVKAEPEEDE